MLFDCLKSKTDQPTGQEGKPAQSDPAPANRLNDSAEVLRAQAITEEALCTASNDGQNNDQNGTAGQATGVAICPKGKLKADDVTAAFQNLSRCPFGKPIYI